MEVQEGSSAAEFVLRGRPLKLQHCSLKTEAGQWVGDIPLFQIVHELSYQLLWVKEEESWRINIEVEKQVRSASLSAQPSIRESETLQVLCDATMEDLNLVPQHQSYDVGLLSGLQERVQGLPTRHILLRKGQIGKPWVQAFVKRHVCTLGLPWPDAVRYLPTLLATHRGGLPAFAHLNNFLFYGPEFEKYSDDASSEDESDELNPTSLDKLMKALKTTGCIGVAFLDVDFTMDHFPYLFNTSTYLALRSYLALRGYLVRTAGIKVEIELSRALTPGREGKVSQLLLEGFRFEDEEAGMLIRALDNTVCTLTRLDLRGSYFDSPRLVGELAVAVSGNRALTDLGLEIDNTDHMKALLDYGLHTGLHTLRIRISMSGFYGAGECWQMLAQKGLAGSSCTLRFLECQLDFIADWSDIWSPLVQRNAPASLNALRITLSPRRPTRDSSGVVYTAGLAKYLSCCSLVHLEVISESTTTHLDDEWECANSLINNFCLLSLTLPWQNKAAQTHAASFIRRNNLYAAGQLLKEPQVKPNTAKLFLCGHAEVGKTTLCRALHRGSKNPWLTSPVCARAPKRTRGMEFHSLGFRGTNKKLLICDLAGQEEFHVFHHYFMKANNNDLFIVVCRVDSSSSQQEFQCQLDYWLRFIVSHRSTRNNVNLAKHPKDANHSDIKPKVIVVVNFFKQDETSDAMRSITSSWSEDVLQKFSADLNFGVQNLFGLNARTGHGVPPLKSTLDSLFKDFIKTAWPIPMLCYDISARLLIKGNHSKWLCPGIFATGQKESMLLKSYSEVLEMISDSKIEPIRVQAALEELHNQGFVLFFPQDEMKTAGQGNDSDQGTLVITDTNWFCNKLIGSLLGTHLKDEPKRSSGWVWDIEDIKMMLRRHGCEEMHLEEILHYLQHLELCTPLDIEPGQRQRHLLFPALVKQRAIQFPVVSNANDCMTTGFFGRRLRCRDSSIHLIPFGVFTRLQVKLHKKYAVSNNTFHLGYGWVSFVRGNVGVVVRFGGDTAIHEAWESKQWVDILTFCPVSSRHTASSNASKIISIGTHGGHHNIRPMDDPTFISGNKLMDEIRTLVYASCKLNEFGGIPSVMLQECVLQGKEPHSWAVPLSSVLDKVRTQGLHESFQEWAIHIPSTPVINLLLPKEIENCVTDLFNVLVNIEEEFSSNLPPDGESSQKQDHGNCLGELDRKILELDQEQENTEIERNHGVHNFDQEHVKVKHQSGKHESSSASGKQIADDQFQALLVAEVRRTRSDIKRCIKSELEGLERRQQKMLQRLDSTLKMIREDIRNLGDVLRQAEQDIIANCSTRLLIHELRKDRAYPVYPYLVDATGKLAPLKALFGKRAVVHFMCESPTEGPHPVEKQKGKEVTMVVKQWVAKVARVMVPAVTIICCLARLAATIYLPSTQVFIPTPEALVSGLGIDRNALQHIILPKALEALLDHVDLWSKLSQPQLHSTDVLQQQDVKEAMEALLQNVEVDMASDFGLHRLYFDDVEGHTFWVCDRHVHNGKRLQPISNPFRWS